MNVLLAKVFYELRPVSTCTGVRHSSTAANLRDVIKQRRAEAMEVFSKKNVDEFVGFFTPNATLMFPGNDFIIGHEGTCRNSSGLSE